jgi:hypothetical protein
MTACLMRSASISSRAPSYLRFTSNTPVSSQ